MGRDCRLLEGAQPAVLSMGDHHLIVATSFDSTGKRSIEINVGMGSVDLNPGRNQPT